MLCNDTFLIVLGSITILTYGSQYSIWHFLPLFHFIQNNWSARVGKQWAHQQLELRHMSQSLSLVLRARRLGYCKINAKTVWQNDGVLKTHNSLVIIWIEMFSGGAFLFSYFHISIFMNSNCVIVQKYLVKCQGIEIWHECWSQKIFQPITVHTALSTIALKPNIQNSETRETTYLMNSSVCAAAIQGIKW